MAPDASDLEHTLMLLRTYDVSRYECSEFTIEMRPPEVPEKAVEVVPVAERGKVTKPEDTPYHKLFGGQMPAFKPSEG